MAERPTPARPVSPRLANAGPVQTFVPFESFTHSAAVLDQRRLGKQRVEILQILRALARPGYGWGSYPAVLMWRGHEEALGAYARAVADAWDALGFRDTTRTSIAAELAALGIDTVRSQEELAAAGQLPAWLGDPQLHRSHRSALIRKDPDHYGRHFPEDREDVPYHWPVRSPEAIEAEQRRARAAEARREREGRRVAEEAAKAARRRSQAAKKAARTRKANAARVARASSARGPNGPTGPDLPPSS